MESANRRRHEHHLQKLKVPKQLKIKSEGVVKVAATPAPVSKEGEGSTRNVKNQIAKWGEESDGARSSEGFVFVCRPPGGEATTLSPKRTGG